MKSIDNVIKKYDGHKEYEIEKDKFLIYISIPINQLLRDKIRQFKDRLRK